MKTTRRAWLAGLGATAALAPFIPVSRAGDGTDLRRLVVFFSSNGTIAEAWDPDEDLSLGPILKPLAPFSDDLLLVSGLRMECAYHGTAQAHAPSMNGMLTGTIAIPNGPGGEAAEHGLASGISVDQLLAGRLSGVTKFGSLELGVGADGGVGDALGHLSYAGPEQPLLPENDPKQVFARVFSELMPGGDLERLHARRRSVLDHVRRDVAALEAKLPAEDRIKMQAHQQAIRDIEQSLGAGMGGGATAACAVPPEPSVMGSDGPAGGLPGVVGSVPEVARAQIDLLVMALACDLTRVGSLMIGGGGSGMVYDWLGHAADHHTLAHDEANPSSRQKLVEINTWYADQLAYLLQSLRAIPEGDGTMADHTVVVWVNELATGSHAYEPMRVAMTGGGYFQGGRHLVVPGGPREYNNLLVSLCHSMGCDDVTSFGDPQFCDGPLAGL